MTGFWKVFLSTALVVAIAVAVVGTLAVGVLSGRASQQAQKLAMFEWAFVLPQTKGLVSV